MKINKPKNQTAEVLYLLLTQKSINRLTALKDVGVLNLTARISNLRINYDLLVNCNKIETSNKFGRAIKYGEWSLKTSKSKALIVYDKINR